jgi:hypothetical protein
VVNFEAFLEGIAHKIAQLSSLNINEIAKSDVSLLPQSQVDSHHRIFASFREFSVRLQCFQWLMLWMSFSGFWVDVDEDASGDEE